MIISELTTTAQSEAAGEWQSTQAATSINRENMMLVVTTENLAGHQVTETVRNEGEEHSMITAPKRNQSKARKVATQAYPFRCCVVCGLQIEGLTIAHLDHNSACNDKDNLAWMCWTHHWMFDADLYPIEAIKLMRAKWQETQGEPHRIPMIGAGIKAAATRKRSLSARKAWENRLGLP